MTSIAITIVAILAVLALIGWASTLGDCTKSGHRFGRWSRLREGQVQIRTCRRCGLIERHVP